MFGVFFAITSSQLVTKLTLALRFLACLFSSSVSLYFTTYAHLCFSCRTPTVSALCWSWLTKLAAMSLGKASHATFRWCNRQWQQMSRTYNILIMFMEHVALIVVQYVLACTSKYDLGNDVVYDSSELLSMAWACVSRPSTDLRSLSFSYLPRMVSGRRLALLASEK